MADWESRWSTGWCTRAAVCTIPSQHARAHETMRVGVGLGHPIDRCLAGAGRRDGGWVYRAFLMTEDLADHLALRDDGDEPQRPALTPRAVHQIQRKHPMQQLCPAPMRRRDRGLLCLQPLLARGGDDAPAQMAV